MTFKKILAILLCIFMLSMTAIGCNRDTPEDPPFETPPGNEPSVNQPGDFGSQPYIDFDAAFATFPAETVMFTAGAFEVTWGELFFLLHGNMVALMSSFGMIPDLNFPATDGRTYAETILDFTVEAAHQYRAFAHGFNELGLTLSEVEQELLAYSFDSMVEVAGTEEELLELLWEHNGIYDLELFRRLLYLDYLPLAVFFGLFGQDAEQITDDTAALFTMLDGYMMAKHILLFKGQGDEEAEAALNGIEDILALLVEYDGDDFEAFFDELMFEHSDDVGGVRSFPDGYLFQPNDMETPFYEATIQLVAGELSGIVETAFGYHVILRLPINYDVAPISSAVLGDDTPLRMIIALEMFDLAVDEWMDLTSPVFSPEFETLDIVALFTPESD